MGTSLRELRHTVAERDGSTCRYCGRRLIELPFGQSPAPQEVDQVATLDHWVPVGRGGRRYDPTNAVLACGPCNRDKAHLTGPEYLLVLAYRRAIEPAETALTAA